MTTLLDISHSKEIYSVSRLNREIRFLLEDHFPAVWIEGEISNFSAPSSGHWYFSLKDSNAQVRCAMFKPQNRYLTILPKEGMHILLKARVSLYEGRGDYQLLVEHLEEVGEGRLRQEFEILKKRLLTAGLFDESHKKSIPTFPKTIGIITSATGAAVHDILSVLNRRFPSVGIIIYPTLVQGSTAASTIVSAIQTANQRNECDVILLARGGGSLEDLWPFNEEKVAYAIYDSHLPIISGIGHEVDFTIADFVADYRAPTPSAAAELITPHKNDLLKMIQNLQRQMTLLIKTQLQQFQQNLMWSQKQLQHQHPKQRLVEKAQQLDQLEITLVTLLIKKQTAYQANLDTLSAKLRGLTPQHKIRERLHQTQHFEKSLRSSMLQTLQHQQQLLCYLGAKLDTLSPLSTLKRGFAIAVTPKDQHILRNSNEVKPGDRIQVKLMEGELDCLVEKIAT